jgi:hypothetical protein
VDSFIRGFVSDPGIGGTCAKVTDLSHMGCIYRAIAPSG